MKRSIYGIATLTLLLAFSSAHAINKKARSIRHKINSSDHTRTTTSATVYQCDGFSTASGRNFSINCTGSAALDGDNSTKRSLTGSNASAIASADCTQTSSSEKTAMKSAGTVTCDSSASMSLSQCNAKNKRINTGRTLVTAICSSMTADSTTSSALSICIAGASSADPSVCFPTTWTIV